MFDQKESKQCNGGKIEFLINGAEKKINLEETIIYAFTRINLKWVIKSECRHSVMSNSL